MTDVLYSFGTSAMLNGRRDLFRPMVFRGLWALVWDVITAGEVRSVDEVRRELAKRDDDAKRWADAQFRPVLSARSLHTTERNASGARGMSA